MWHPMAFTPSGNPPLIKPARALCIRPLCSDRRPPLDPQNGITLIKNHPLQKVYRKGSWGETVSIRLLPATFPFLDVKVTLLMDRTPVARQDNGPDGGGSLAPPEGFRKPETRGTATDPAAAPAHGHHELDEEDASGRHHHGAKPLFKPPPPASGGGLVRLSTNGRM